MEHSFTRTVLQHCNNTFSRHCSFTNLLNSNFLLGNLETLKCCRMSRKDIKYSNDQNWDMLDIFQKNIFCSVLQNMFFRKHLIKLLLNAISMSNTERRFHFLNIKTFFMCWVRWCNTITASLASQSSIRDYLRSKPLSGHQFTGP